MPFAAIAIAHAVIFRHGDYGSYDTSRYLTHDDIDHERYACEILKIPSGDHNLTGFLYGVGNTIPVLFISGTQDEFYGAESPIFANRSSITNPACVFLYRTRENHNGHYDYFLTDAALSYLNAR